MAERVAGAPTGSDVFTFSRAQVFTTSERARLEADVERLRAGEIVSRVKAEVAKTERAILVAKLVGNISAHSSFAEHVQGLPPEDVVDRLDFVNAVAAGVREQFPLGHRLTTFSSTVDEVYATRDSHAPIDFRVLFLAGW